MQPEKNVRIPTRQKQVKAFFFFFFGKHVTRNRKPPIETHAGVRLVGRVRTKWLIEMETPKM
jgi:hypothetical protein